MSNKTRKNYPLEFKISADQSSAQTSRDLGININTLHNWIAKYSNSNKNNQKNMTGNFQTGAISIKKSVAQRCQGITVRYAWIKNNKNDFSILILCRFMKVSSSGYYSWLNRLPSNRDMENQELQLQIKHVFVSNRHVYGTSRIAKILAQDEIVISRKRIGKLMASAGLFCKTKRRFKVTTDSKHNDPIAPNLLARKFDVPAPDKYWVGDITYIPTKNGWLYLAGGD
ncbi:MAG: transposase-like protein [Granulosicoccus sp.]|jgi:transposase-like protein